MVIGNKNEVNNVVDDLFWSFHFGWLQFVLFALLTCYHKALLLYNLMSHRLFDYDFVRSNRLEVYLSFFASYRMFAYCPNAITPPTNEYASRTSLVMSKLRHLSQLKFIYCVCVNVVAVYVVAFLNHVQYVQRKKKHANSFCIHWMNTLRQLKKKLLSSFI